MAEGVMYNNEQEHNTSSGVECVYDFHCEVCQDDGLNVEAKGYCVNCQEYVCDICICAHRKVWATRNHVLLDVDSMPKSTPLSQDRVSKDIFTNCKSHNGEVVKFHCRSHDVLGCNTCFVEGHKDCADIVSIYESERILTSREFSDKKATHVCNIDISTSSDTGTKYYLNGCAVMSDTRLLIADHTNRKVKLLNTCTKSVISELNVSDFPMDITKINENQAAVSLSLLKKIILLSVTDELSVDAEIAIHSPCRGVCYTQNMLLVSCACTPPRLEAIDLQGNVINIIDKNPDGSNIFSIPIHICASQNGEDIYVSDIDKGKVFCMTFNGIVKSEYSELSGPRNLCTDQQGRVYVAGNQTKTVHMMTPDCTKIREVLTREDGLHRPVMSVAYCPDTNRLYVGMNDSKYINVYQLYS